jgi:tight adherence protein C
MTAVILVFGGLGAAIAALACLLVRPKPGLLATIGRLDVARAGGVPAPRSANGPTLPGRRRPVDDLVGLVVRRVQVARRSTERLARDLAITERSIEALAARRVLTAVAGFCVLPALALAIAPAGLRLPAVALFVGIPVFAVGGFFLPEVAVRAEAERRRREFRRALSCYLDLVAMSLSGGRGAPQALPEAAALSDGWAFRLIGDALDVARLAGHSPWRGLGDLGERIGVPDLCELAGSLALVGDHGARVRDTLTARAATLRRRALTDAEGQAAQADQAMRIAQVLLAFGFLVLVAYPALAAVLLL